jgi:hypothetical protein
VADFVRHPDDAVSGEAARGCDTGR